jgi:hypothetical protein
MPANAADQEANMSTPDENTMPQKDTFGESEEEVLTPVGLEEYRRVMDSFHLSLYRLQTSLFIMDKIESFPFDLFTTVDDTVFLSHVIIVFRDDALMTIHKLVVDEDGSYTIQQLKNKIISKVTGFIKDEYRASFINRINIVQFESKTKLARKIVNDLRNDRIGHSTKDWVLGKSTIPLLRLEEFRNLIKATQELFDALCFTTERVLLPLPYNPAVTHPKGADARPDIEKILDAIARDSYILSMPEDERFPGDWVEERKRLTAEQIEQINYYRRKFRLPEA